MLTPNGDGGQERSVVLDACLYSLPWRLAAANLVAISRASLPFILLLVLGANDPPITPPVLFRLFALLVVLPALAERLIRHLLAATVQVGATELVLRRRGLQMEIPYRAIERIGPWLLPLPAAGFTLGLRSGRRIRLSAADPTDLLRALADAGVVAAGAASSHPTMVYAHALTAAPRRRWYHRLGKFVAFALLPTALLFNVHQHIAYGGPLGQYYLLGLTAYLTTFAVYWSTISIYLILYASILRGLAEGVSLLVAWVKPTRCASFRRRSEQACSVLYYGGVPVMLAMRFWP